MKKLDNNEVLLEVPPFKLDNGVPENLEELYERARNYVKKYGYSVEKGNRLYLGTHELGNMSLIFSMDGTDEEVGSLTVHICHNKKK